MFENPRRGRQARNFTKNVPKILDLKSSSEQIFSRKLSLGAPGSLRFREDDYDEHDNHDHPEGNILDIVNVFIFSWTRVTCFEFNIFSYSAAWLYL